MTTLAAGSTTTLHLPAGERLTVVSQGAAGVVELASSAGGASNKLPDVAVGTHIYGPFAAPKQLLLTALDAPLTYQHSVPNSPTCTDQPSVTGTYIEFLTLTAVKGGWGGSPFAYLYQWLRDGEGIADATAETYVLATADVSHEVSVRVTAVDAGGSASAESARNTVQPD